MTAAFRPMLASPADLATLRYPVLASPKLDGVRAIVKDGVVLSRSLKPIPNKYVQSLFSKCNYLDGELIVGSPTSKTCYTDTVSGVMRVDGEPDVGFFIFDNTYAHDKPYLERFGKPLMSYGTRTYGHDQVHIGDEPALLKYEEQCLNLGYEGLILRDPNGRYKFGRSTTNEGLLLKLKRWADHDFEIVGFEERMHNGNEAATNELGRTKRSSHKENKTGRGDLGALILKFEGGTFNCGTGFDDALRAEIWANRSKYLGKFAKVKHFEIGAKDAPRFPVFIGFRSKLDMS